mgnify:CR=1 FL=1
MSDTTQPDDGGVSITRRRAIAGAVVDANGVEVTVGGSATVRIGETDA